MGKNKRRRISIRAVRKDPPDLRKLSRALIALAIAQEEAEAQAEHEGRGNTKSKKPKKRGRAS